MSMLQIDNTIVSLDLFDECFVCDLATCKGICCVEGDAGAPLEAGEADKLEEILPAVWDDLSDAAREVIRRQGVCYVDEEGDTVTSIVDGRECVFTCIDADGMCRCAVEKSLPGRAHRFLQTRLLPLVSGARASVRRFRGGELSPLGGVPVCQDAGRAVGRAGVPVFERTPGAPFRGSMVQANGNSGTRIKTA